MFALLAAAFAAAPPSIEEPHRTGARAAGDAAVVIGNEDYAWLPDVPYAARDADAMYGTLLYTVGVPAERITDLRGASREQILQAVGEAAERVEGGTLWVYYAGHGAASLHDGQRMLVGDDAKPDASTFDARSVRLAELEEAAGNKPLVLLLDTCFTGTGRSGEALVSGARFAVPSWAATKTRTFAAAGPDQTAGAWDAAEHGWFTYFLAGAMRGWADGELDGQRNGSVTASEAEAFVRRALSTLQVSGQRPELLASDKSWALSAGREAAPDLAALDRRGPVAVTPTPMPDGSFRVGPLEHVKGSLYQDARGQPVAWLEVRELARRDPKGLAAVQARSRTFWSQFAVGALAGEFLIAGPLTWGLFAGDCQADPSDCTLKNFGVGMTVTGLAFAGWEVYLVSRHRQHTKAVLKAANREL